MVARVELVVVFAVRTLYLAVMTRCVRADQLVFNAKTLQSAFKERRFDFLRGRKTISKLKAVVRLNALDRNAAPFKPLHDTLGEVRR